MKLSVFAVPWTAGSPKPKDILEKFFSGKYNLVDPGSPMAPHFHLEVSEEEFAGFIASAEVDVLISHRPDGSKFVAFDKMNGLFRSR